MQFSQYTWDLYKKSEHGKEIIDSFLPNNVFLNDLEILQKFNPTHWQLINPYYYEELCQVIADWYNETNFHNLNNISNVREFYEYILDNGFYIKYDNEIIYKIASGDYQNLLGLNTLLSFFFYDIAPYFCFPNLFVYRFFDLVKIADTFEVELPNIPKKSDYKTRCLYYVDLCETFHGFRVKNNLLPNEFCAFLYDFAPNFTQKLTDELPDPEQAWFIGGVISKTEKESKAPFWQSSSETKKGDILVHYETSPISAITHIWISQTNGVIDPFFHYYSNVYLGNKIEIPHITLGELRNDFYFSKHPLVRKNFQGVNGWSLSSDDYNELKRLIREKGYNGILPELYVPNIPQNKLIGNERDVEVELLEYYLSAMGFVEGIDYIRQLPIRAGRGSRIFPDYALHFSDSNGYSKAQTLIEVKFRMKNNKEVEEAFKQARSYAQLLESNTIILCDKDVLIVFQKGNSFDRDNFTKTYWGELSNPDVYNSLKTILLKKSN